MTYIRELDVEFPDPRLSEPATCPFCGKAGTREDFTEVDEAITLDGKVVRRLEALVCPWCGGLFGDEDEAPEDPS